MPVRAPNPDQDGDTKHYAVATCSWLPVLVSATFLQGGLTGQLARQLVEAALWNNAAPLNKTWIAVQFVWVVCYPLVLYRLSSITCLPDDTVPTYDNCKSPFQYHIALQGSTLGVLGLTLFSSGCVAGLTPWHREYFSDFRLFGAALFLVSLILVALGAAGYSTRRIRPAA